MLNCPRLCSKNLYQHAECNRSDEDDDATYKGDVVLYQVDSTYHALANFVSVRHQANQ